MAALKCAVFLGSVRENNFGSRVAKFIMNKLAARGFDATLLGKLKETSCCNRAYIID